jgi:EAL domain-containing protein (putative c-di-GMP-specific phosphodiesterase class I)
MPGPETQYAGIPLPGPDFYGLISGWGADMCDLDAAVAGVGIKSIFQPIVLLEDQTTVGYEALTRWPSLDIFDPNDVFVRAGTTGAVGQLNDLCIDTAINAALTAGVGAGPVTLVNCEPGCILPRRSENVTLARAFEQLQLVFELTEREILANPAALERQVSRLRDDGFGIALDDVGSVPGSLAALDIVAPDLVKLNLSVVQSPLLNDDHARTLAAVLAYHERTNATILAEGIETDAHLEQALALGATVGQGFRFGAPGPKQRYQPRPWSMPTTTPPVDDERGSLFSLAEAHAPVHTARKPTLIALSRNIEAQAVRTDDAPLVLAALQHARHYTPATRAQYRELAACCPSVTIFGQQLPAGLDPGIRGVALPASDPLCAEWIVLTLGPLSTTALVAREHDPHCTEPDRRFDFAITHDRALVTALARSLLRRIPTFAAG